MIFETLKPRSEGAVLFVDIEAPPMNLLGPELVRDLVSLIRGKPRPTAASGYSSSKVRTPTISSHTST